MEIERRFGNAEASLAMESVRHLPESDQSVDSLYLLSVTAGRLLMSLYPALLPHYLCPLDLDQNTSLSFRQDVAKPLLQFAYTLDSESPLQEVQLLVAGDGQGSLLSALYPECRLG
jgi:hypothetical protein